MGSTPFGYTFHLNDASSEIRPRYSVHFICDASVYDNNSAAFEKAGLTPSPMYSHNRYSCSSNTVYLGSDADIAMEDVCKLLDTSIIRERNGTRVSFHVENDLTNAEACYNKFSDFCKKYKTVKIAYLDKDGNVLNTTDAVSIYKTDFLGRDPSVTLHLSGNELTSSIIFAPPVFLVALFFLLIVFVILVSVLIRLIVFIVNCLKRKKVH